MHLHRHVRLRYGYVSLMLRSAVFCSAPRLGVFLSWFFVARLEASQTFRTLHSAGDFCEECGISFRRHEHIDIFCIVVLSYVKHIFQNTSLSIH